MYPNEIFFGIDLYMLMLCVAVVAAMIVYRFVADRRGIGASLQNLCLFDAVASVVVGYFFAVLFQAFYNIPKYGEFRLDSKTGATFYGGLIGGAACFILVYFIVGKFLFKSTKEHISEFRTITDIAAPCIAIAHAFGRLGCFFAGCCHGKETDAWYGIYMQSINKRVVPIQLYEAIVLFILFAWFIIRVLKNKTYNLMNLTKELYFVTSTVVDWIHVFTRPIYKHIILDSLKYNDYQIYYLKCNVALQCRWK